MTEDATNLGNNVVKALEQYSIDLESEFTGIVQAWPQELLKKPIPRILGGLIARHVTLTTWFVASRNYWNPHLGPLMLRALQESWLKIAWLLKEPLKRSSGIATADLRAAKSRVESMASRTEEQTAKDRTPEIIKLLDEEKSICSTEFKPIMVDARKMANDLAGEALIAYKRHNVLFTACVHSSWNHLAKFNLITNPNPLHRYQFVPMWKEHFPPEIEYPLMSAEYWDQIYSALLNDSHDKKETSYERLLTKLKSLGVIEDPVADKDSENNNFNKDQ